jgi:FkbM family methyltransferase
VDLQSLAGNARVSWQRRASASDFVRRLAWLYSHRLPRSLCPRTWTIGFHYPAPLGPLRLCVRSNQGADAFVHSEVFEHEHYRLPLAHPPGTILDLGSNIGLSAVYFGRRYPAAAIACVEPWPDNLRLLANNLALNGVRAAIIPEAVHASDGRVLLERGARDYAHRIVMPAEGEAKPRLEVDAVSVPTALRRLGWDRIGLLKVDIEGHEAVLFGGDCAWLNQVDAMCIEWHVEDGPARLASLARRFGFSEPRRLPGAWFISKTAN